jgi:uncharacterized protein YbjT (DUF2867 family)
MVLGSNQELAGVRCVVTGANGLIGTALCQRLLAANQLATGIHDAPTRIR